VVINALPTAARPSFTKRAGAASNSPAGTPQADKPGNLESLLPPVSSGTERRLTALKRKICTNENSHTGGGKHQRAGQGIEFLGTCT